MPLPRAHRAPTDPRMPRAAVVCAWLGLLAVAGFGLFLRLGSTGPLGIDLAWHSAVSAERGGIAYAIAVFLAQIGGSLGAAVCVAIAAALLFAVQRPRDALVIMTAALLGVALSELGKALVLRPRPWDQLYASHGASYPSGHSMGAAALATSLALIWIGSGYATRQSTRLAIGIAAAWILLMMWSRTALHVHWLSDTVGGAILGVSAAILARAWWYRRTPVATLARAEKHQLR